ncbi:MAG: D-alanyl-D-alanine carboxypeptidase [Alphaproteobacteria bacterium]|nr:D-alanyl-D-alanine carboxypeptidase [Alphaproteobacteria bacterium]
MRRLGFGIALVLSLFMAPLQGFAEQPETIAKEAYIIDATSGAVLLDKDSGKRIPTASMSKIMTMAVVFQAIKDGQLSLQQSLPVSEKAWKMEGSKMFVEVGKQVPVEDLIKGVIVQSGNDATVVLAEGVAGSEDKFAGMMNDKAQMWGLTGSHFMNASGMPDPNHYSTPRDLAVLAWHLITEFPEDYKYYAMPEYTYNGITQQNRNPLIGKVTGADGVKTGHTEEAGYCLIGSAVRDGRRVIMVLAGLASWDDREKESVRLMNWALDSFKIGRLVKQGQELVKAPVVYGASDNVMLVAGRDAVATIPASMTLKDVTVKVKYNSPLVAPLKAGQEVGSVTVSGQGIVEQTFPMVTAQAVEQKGFIGLTFDKIIQAAKNK